MIGNELGYNGENDMSNQRKRWPQTDTKNFEAKPNHQETASRSLEKLTFSSWDVELHL